MRHTRAWDEIDPLSDVHPALQQQEIEQKRAEIERRLMAHSFVQSILHDEEANSSGLFCIQGGGEIMTLAADQDAPTLFDLRDQLARSAFDRKVRGLGSGAEIRKVTFTNKGEDWQVNIITRVPGGASADMGGQVRTIDVPKDISHDVMERSFSGEPTPPFRMGSSRKVAPLLERVASYLRETSPGGILTDAAAHVAFGVAGAAIATVAVPLAAAVVGSYGGVVKLSEWLEDRNQDQFFKAVFDQPETQAVMKHVASRAREVVAAQRGTVWLVKEPGHDLPKVMDDAEYKTFKTELAKSGRQLDEMTIGRAPDRDLTITVRRYAGGKLDSGIRDLPALQIYELSAHTSRESNAYFDQGRVATLETVVKRNASTLAPQENAGPRRA